MNWYKIDFNDVFMNGLTTAEVGCVVKYKCLCQQLEVDAPDIKKLKSVFNSRELKFVQKYFGLCSEFDTSLSEVNQEFVQSLSEVCSKSDNKNKDLTIIHNKDKKKKKDIKKINKKSFSKEFEEWWAEVPRKKSKDEAFRKFNTILAGKVATFDELMDGIKQYAEHCAKTKTEEKFIKHPSTWLNQGCWKDEYKQENSLDWLENKPKQSDDDFWREIERANGIC